MIKIGIADDHPFLRKGIINLLEEEGLEIAFEAGDGEEVLSLLRASKKYEDYIDVLILDINMKPMTGTECLKILADEFPELKVIMISNFDDPYVIKEHWDLGAACYVLKTQGPEHVADAIKEVHSKGFYITAEMIPAITSRPKAKARNTIENRKENLKLTDKEIEMMNLMFHQEYNSQELADHFGIKPGTVDNAKSRLYDKFRMVGEKIHGEVGLMRLAVQYQLIDDKFKREEGFN